MKPSTLSKRWKTSLPNRVWPYRAAKKLQKQILSLQDLETKGFNVRSELEQLTNIRRATLDPAVIIINDKLEDSIRSQAGEPESPPSPPLVPSTPSLSSSQTPHHLSSGMPSMFLPDNSTPLHSGGISPSSLHSSGGIAPPSLHSSGSIPPPTLHSSGGITPSFSSVPTMFSPSSYPSLNPQQVPPSPHHTTISPSIDSFEQPPPT